MTFTIDLPADLEARLRAEIADLDADARRAYAIELYRQERITQSELARILGVTRMETDGILKAAGVYLKMTAEDVIADADRSRDARERAGRPVAGQGAR